MPDRLAGVLLFFRFIPDWPRMDWRELGENEVARIGILKAEGISRSTPSESSVELALRRLASDSGDDTADPFRVALLKIHGGQPPRYTLVVVSPKQMLLREKLGLVVGRSFSLGVRSFLLTVPEALRLILKYEGAEQGPEIRSDAR
jgi:hypothetical protein